MKVLVVLCFVLGSALAGTVRNQLEGNLAPWTESEGRITNGNIAAPGQFPYQVGIFLKFGKQSAFCGGSLISKRWIVTAAHCTNEAEGATVHLGASNIRLDNEKGQQRIYVSPSGIITHAGYSNQTLVNDIALIKLPVEIEYNDRIQPILLPKMSGQYSTYVGDKVIASGWGLTGDSETSISEQLNYIDTTVMSQNTCKIYYVGQVNNDMICIDGKDKRSTCQGDSGGPLAHDDGDEKTLIGLTSFGIKLGCEKGWPGVFTRITSYLDWIHDNTQLSR